MRLQLRRQPLVVVVDEGDVFGTRGGDAAILAGSSASPGLLAKIDDPRIIEARDDIRRRIRRSAVDDDQLEVREGLREYALDGTLDEVRAIPRRKKNADVRRRAHAPLHTRARTGFASSKRR